MSGGFDFQALGSLIKKIPYSWADDAGEATGKWGEGAGALEKLDNWTQNIVELALIGIGVPPADALVMGKFIAFFI
ncbi:hypothetical protein M3E13_04115 [Oceanobacillus kimchii]|uniref:hypothetical protein n=1 Tax=Oceanobacillus kimchii TaxID=746691 RepID=UPI0021A8A7C0|nr:hypothetical protein [Oceanobacillus kimchii]MCT1577027.1 hypothetical protein [Oceanobacillus kimchii]MCT2135097.1 hypothetical protein [Oceanobacillus kimchii]